MELKHLNLESYSALFPISFRRPPSLKGNKTSQYELAKDNTWGIIVPFRKIDDRIFSKQNNTNYTSTEAYQYLFWKDNDKHMIFLDMRGKDIKSTRLTKTGKYFIITTYNNEILLFDIFRQLMFNCNNFYLSKLLSSHSRLFRDIDFINSYNPEGYRYLFVKFSDDFTKAYLTKYSLNGKKIYQNSKCALCLASGYVYDYNWEY